MKHLFTTAALLFSMTAFAQVGINNTSPKATLDITAKTSGTKPEGLIIPQLSGDQIRTATAGAVYGTSQKGLIVYASSADTAPAGATAGITAAGYYYFDGGVWQKIVTGNTLGTSLASGNILLGNASNVATAVSPTGDVTISNAGVTSIGAGKVTNSQMANTAALTVKGNATNAAAAPTDIVAGTDGYVLRRSGTTLGFGTVATAGIADGAVTAAKLNQMSATSGQILAWNGTNWAPATDATGVSTTLSSGKIYVGNASNVATAITPTGDVMIDNAGVTSIGAGKVTNSQLSAVSTGTGGIYKGSGSLAGNTTVAQNANTLDFTSTATTGTSHFTVDGSTLNVDAVNNRVGIGTPSPGNLLEINNSSGTNTGLKLPTGAASGKTLVSDTNGNAFWQSTQISQFQTIVTSSGNNLSFPVSGVQQWTLFDKFTNVVVDDVKATYGSSYGWDTTNQNFRVPRNGKYRITVNVYFNSGTPGENWRAAIQLNNSSSHETIASMPFASITVSNNDQISVISGIAVLSAGDLVSLKVSNFTSTNPVKVYGLNSHTLLTIEAL